MDMLNTSNITRILAAIRNNNGMIIDDDAPVDTAFKIKYCALMNEGKEEYVMSLFEHAEFPQSFIYLDKDSKPHMRFIKGKPQRIISTKNINVFDYISRDDNCILVVEI